MVKLTRIYTRGGDKGKTSLGRGERVAKHDPRVEAYGAIDELNAALGPELQFLGTTLNAHSVNSWFGSAFVMLTGLGLFEVTRRHFVRQWGEIQEFIEKEMKRREMLCARCPTASSQPTAPSRFRKRRLRQWHKPELRRLMRWS